MMWDYLEVLNAHVCDQLKVLSSRRRRSTQVFSCLSLVLCLYSCLFSFVYTHVCVCVHRLFMSVSVSSSKYSGGGCLLSWALVAIIRSKNWLIADRQLSALGITRIAIICFDIIFPPSLMILTQIQPFRQRQMQTFG